MRSLIKKNVLLSTCALIMALIFIAGCQQQNPDPSQELKPLLDKGVAIWNNGNLDEVDELWDPNVVRSANQLPDVEGIEGIKAVITSFRTAYPDAKLTIDEEVYSDNKAIIRWTFTGTNTGESEMPPTGKQIKIWGISILHFANGKLTREYVSFDNQPLMEQLGFTMVPLTADE